MAYLKIWKDGKLIKEKQIEDAKALRGYKIKLGSDRSVILKTGETKTIGKYKLEIVTESYEQVEDTGAKLFLETPATQPSNDKPTTTNFFQEYRVLVSIAAIVLVVLIGTALFAYIKMNESRAKVKTVQKELETQKEVLTGKYLAAKEQLQSKPEDEETIRRFAQDFVAGFVANDSALFEAVMDLLADDFTGIMSDGTTIQGKQKAIELYRQASEQVNNFAKNVKIDYQIESVKQTANSATVFGKLTLSGQVEKNGQSFSSEIWETLTFQKTNGSWRLTMEHSTGLNGKSSSQQVKEQLAAAKTDVKEERIKGKLASGNTESDIDKKEKLSAEQYENVKKHISWIKEGSICGIGVNIEKVEKGLIVRKVIGEPAKEAGLVAGDVITAVEGNPTVDMTIKEAVGMITGPEGSVVRLTIHNSKGRTQQVEVTRAKITVSCVDSKIVENNIGLIRIGCVNKNTVDRVKEALDEFKQQNVSGIILDLRGNKSGFYPELIKLTDIFISDGKTLWLSRKAGSEYEYVKSENSSLTDLPVAVLIDEKTGCGGELLASAFKRNRRGTLIGHKTIGEASIKKFVEKPDGTAEKVIIAKLFIRPGQPITGRGILPNIKMSADATPEQFIEKAVQVLQKKIKFPK